jgi:hypothetical protein
MHRRTGKTPIGETTIKARVPERDRRTAQIQPLKRANFTPQPLNGGAPAAWSGGRGLRLIGNTPMHW